MLKVPLLLFPLVSNITFSYSVGAKLFERCYPHQEGSLEWFLFYPSVDSLIVRLEFEQKDGLFFITGPLIY